MTFKKNVQLQKAKNELKLIIQKIKTGYGPEKIILFGSLAEGEITDSSDIDLVIVKKTHKNPWVRLREVDRFIEHNFPVDFLVYTPEEIKQGLRSGDTFVEDFMEKGKVVYEK